MEIVVIGTAFMDIKGFPGGTFVPGCCNAGRVEYVHGGVARNVAEDLAHLGAEVTYLGIVDNSPVGDSVIRHLQQQGINTEYVLTRPDGMGAWMAVFNERGNLAASVSRQPDMLPLAEVLSDRGDEIFSKADSTVMEADLPREVVEKAAELAGKFHIPLIAALSNMAGVMEHKDMLRRFDCVICNRREADILFDSNDGEKDRKKQTEQLSREIRRCGIPAMIVTLGEDGAVYASQSGETGFCPARPAAAVDVTGAGDSFCAGVAAGLTCHKSLKAAVEIGTRLAAETVASFSNVCPPTDPRKLGLQ